jgi:predicted transcriptional regulator
VFHARGFNGQYANGGVKVAWAGRDFFAGAVFGESLVVLKRTNRSAMSVLELKAKIHQLVDEADDEAQLQTWFALLSGQILDEEVELTPEWEARIEKSIQSVREGRYITHEEMKKRMKEWPAR